LRRAWQPLYLQRGAFEFNPARHDFGDKVFLGHPIHGSGFDEVRQAVNLIIAQPACGRFVSRELARYFVADDPPDALVERMAARFRKSDGDIAAVLRTLFDAPEFEQSLGRKFKDPMQFVVSALRRAYDGRPIVNAHPVMSWLNSLGEPLFGHLTPDGYPSDARSWSGSGQMSQRFVVARAIGGNSKRLFEPDDGSVPTTAGFPRLASRLYFETIEPTLSTATQHALDSAASQLEWNTYLLSSPDFNYR
jgi:uncharacterized protein (DUF1800 family)